MFESLLIHRVSRVAIGIAFFFSVFTITTETAAGTQETAKELEAIRSQIDAIESSLKGSKAKRGKLRDELRDTEKHIGKISNNLNKLNREKKQQQAELSRLHRKEKTMRDTLEIHFQSLREHIKTGYAIGRQGMIKMLLNQQDPEKLGRHLNYYRYLNNARLEEINKLDTQLEEVTELTRLIQTKTASLEALHKDALEQKQALNKDKQYRQGLLAKLNSDIKQKDRKLEQLAENAQQLEKLIRDLGNISTLLPDTPLDKPFAQLKGKLSWPTKGRLSARYGQRRDSGKLKWQGIMIDAKEGTEIHAIAAGRVIFADWLRGYGLLIILDHGGDYLSLYGHNQSLYKENGDWVSADELIAGAGNSGGRNTSGLYFEIRHKGKPNNPVAWLHGSSPK